MDELCDSILSLGYQFILVDCPAGIDVGFINAISPAKEALIVTTPEITSIRDAGGCFDAAFIEAAGGGACGCMENCQPSLQIELRV
jgi:septum formation inhibitor-activating ATPase MinD